MEPIAVLGIFISLYNLIGEYKGTKKINFAYLLFLIFSGVLLWLSLNGLYLVDNGYYIGGKYGHGKSISIYYKNTNISNCLAIGIMALFFGLLLFGNIYERFSSKKNKEFGSFIKSPVSGEDIAFKLYDIFVLKEPISIDKLKRSNIIHKKCEYYYSYNAGNGLKITLDGPATNYYSNGIIINYDKDNVLGSFYVNGKSTCVSTNRGIVVGSSSDYVISIYGIPKYYQEDYYGYEVENYGVLFFEISNSTVVGFGGHCL